MKSKSVNKSGYNFTLAELIMTANMYKSIYRRDIAKLSEVGVMPEHLTAYEQKVAELEQLPTDLEMETLKMIATESKNQLAEELRTGIKKLSVMAKRVYGEESAEARPYIIEAPSKLNDIELSHYSDVLARTAKAHIADFTSVNLTVEYCDELIAKQVAFKEKQMEINDLIASRDKATQNRWEKANEVYKEMSLLCEAGKTVWESESEADYNDYVMYPSSSSSKTESEEITEPEPEVEPIPEIG